MDKYDKIIIGLDQSYQNTGVCVLGIIDGKIEKLLLRSLNLFDLGDNTTRRSKLKATLETLILSCKRKTNDIACVMERIRLHSQGFINIDYIKSIGALNCVIVDICYKYDIPTYSVDTRCWRAQVIGTAKPGSTINGYGVASAKWPTVKWVIEQGWESDIVKDITGSRKKKGTFVHNKNKKRAKKHKTRTEIQHTVEFINEHRYMYDEDAADAAGIAMFGFIGERDKLKDEH